MFMCEQKKFYKNNIYTLIITAKVKDFSPVGLNLNLIRAFLIKNEQAPKPWLAPISASPGQAKLNLEKPGQFRIIYSC
jgi:hypothetical protein